MDFSPFNEVVKLCIKGMQQEQNNNPSNALECYMVAWNAANNDFEKYLSSFYIARVQTNTEDKLKWLELSLKHALSINDEAVKSALPNLHKSISKCYLELSNTEKAEEHLNTSEQLRLHPSDIGPFYHGTKANLEIGDSLLPGGNSNYKEDFKMNHIYFTALKNGAGLAAALAKGEGQERVYIVVPEGEFESDPNLTDKKFPGNPSRSYRSSSPLKIIGEAKDWIRYPEEEIEKFRNQLNKSNGEIIN